MRTSISFVKCQNKDKRRSDRYSCCFRKFKDLKLWLFPPASLRTAEETILSPNKIHKGGAEKVKSRFHVKAPASPFCSKLLLAPEKRLVPVAPERRAAQQPVPRRGQTARALIDQMCLRMQRRKHWPDPRRFKLSLDPEFWTCDSGEGKTPFSFAPSEELKPWLNHLKLNVSRLLRI